MTLYQGDVREVLALSPDESVHCVVTSPPYWGLRDYGTEHGRAGMRSAITHRAGGEPRRYVERCTSRRANASRDDRHE